jgi:hypothetical protein
MNEIKKTLPFSLYDFYGYLFPGTLLFYGICVVISIFYGVDLNNDFLKHCGFPEAKGVVGNVFFAVFMLGIIYFLGHINATISHLLVDRTIVKKIIGYPVLRQLKGIGEVREFSRAINMYVLIIFFLWLLIPAFFYNTSELLRYSNKIAIIIIGTLYAIRYLIVILEPFLFKGKAPRTGDFKFNNGPLKILLLIVPYYILTSLFIALKYSVFRPAKKLLSCDESLPEEVVRKFKRNLSALTGLDISANPSEAYWLATIAMNQRCPADYSKIMNWLNLYGFLRNLASVCLILAGIVALILYNSDIKVLDTGFVSGAANIGRFMLGGLILSFGFLFFRFWIIYRNYFSNYIIRAIAIMD